MGSQLLNLTKSLQKLTLSSRLSVPMVLVKPLEDRFKSNQITTSFTRNVNFFNKLPAESLWKGITSVSNAGKKRGRGKNVSKKNIKDLNRGQMIGLGKANIQWPGLNAPIIRGKELVQQQILPEDPEREQKLIQLRNQMGTFKRQKLSPTERGWTGAKMPGRSLGRPDPVGDDNFDGFDSKVLELKTVFNMKGNFGRKRRVAAMVVTGNGNGLGGFSISKGIEPRTAMRKAKNRSAQKLMHIEIFNNHTVYHDFFTQFGATKIYVYRKPEGYGLVCHRAMKTICEVLGIKDLYAKVEGSTNINHITKAFFLGLLRQKTHQEIAEDKKLHLVQFSKANGMYPVVLASPLECRKPAEVPKHETLDFTQYCMGGKVVLQKKKYPPFFVNSRGHEIYLKKKEKMRNHDQVRVNLIAQYGEVRSFLTDKFPECKPPTRKSKEVEAEEKEV